MNEEEILLPTHVMTQYLIDTSPRFRSYLIKYLNDTGQLIEIVLTYCQKVEKDDE